MHQLPNNITPYEEVTFFLIIPLGLEDLAQQELYEKLDLYFPDLPVPEVEIIKGGLQLHWTLLPGLQLNHILKIPTRILLRISEFKCRDLPKLYNKLKKINWKPFFSSAQINFSITATHSRLYHTKRIQQSALAALIDYFKANPPKKKALEISAQEQTLYLRFENDLCSVSLDTSGAPLYKQGKKIFSTAAPIRENLASALLYELYHLGQSKSDQLQLIDPMCGSGTFLFAAATFYQSAQRDFAFYHWPFLQTENRQPPTAHYHPTLFTQLYGFDINPQVVKLAQRNLTAYSLTNITITQRDVLTQQKYSSPISSSAVILNPPYGIRLPSYGQIEEFYHHIFQNLYRDFAPELLGIIIPCGFSYRKIVISPYKLISKRQFSNGGLKVIFHIFSK